MPDDSKNPLHVRARAAGARALSVASEWGRQWRLYNRLLPSAFLFGVLCFLVYYFTIGAPIDFAGASFIHVNDGETPAQVAEALKSRHLIHSAYVFETGVKLFGGRVLPGEYFFASAESSFTIARRMAHGDYELVPVKVTIPEGANTFEMGDLLAQKIPDFDEQSFLEQSLSKEGYLFPDTYFFLPGEKPELVIATMESNFTKHVDDPSVAQAISSFGKPLNDVVTMASLLEKEAPDLHDRQIIAGILWKRIALGMPLQVDAVFPYIIGKNSLQLTHADLKTQSPYNTYTNQGLPPGPITNPGIGSITAAVTPIKTNYLYYLSDLHGNFHYSTTYAQQLANQKKYLK